MLAEQCKRQLRVLIKEHVFKEVVGLLKQLWATTQEKNQLIEAFVKWNEFA